VQDEERQEAQDTLVVKRLRVICGTDGPQEAELTLTIDGVDHSIDATGDGPVDAAFNAVKMLYPHKAVLQLYQVSAVTEGTDAQATVSVRVEEDGRIATGSSADTDTIVASVKAYVNALNRLVQRRLKSAPDSDMKSVNYKDMH
jgi:2-isopropylmalate synthase